MLNQADEWDLLDAIMRRLKEKIDWATDSTCFLSDQPVPDVLPPGNRLLTICLGASQYDQATYMGAGPNGLCEEVGVLVTIINQCVLDSPPRFNQALLHESRGIIKPLKKQVLRALTVSDDQQCENHADQWVPTVKGEPWLRERGVIPQGWQPPLVVIRDSTYVACTLEVRGAFDQDLL